VRPSVEERRCVWVPLLRFGWFFVGLVAWWSIGDEECGCKQSCVDGGVKAESTPRFAASRDVCTSSVEFNDYVFLFNALILTL